MSRLSPPLRYTLAAGLLAVGVGDLVAINLLLTPRYLAAAPVAGRAAASSAREGPNVARAQSPAAAPSASPSRAPSPAAPPAKVGEEIPPAPAVTPPAESAAPPEDKPARVAAAVPAASAPVAQAEATVREPPPKAAPSPTRASEPQLAIADDPSEPVPAAASPPGGARAPGTRGFSDLLFARNATWLSPPSRATLRKVAEMLTLDPDRRVVLGGHCDTVGDPEFNRYLSLARARRASRYLQDQGIAPTRIEIKSFGAARPAEDESPSGIQARNRRVEILVE